MDNRFKRAWFSTVTELPTLIFLIFMLFICFEFHSRKYLMLDYSLTFDHWWYFYHRLQQGELAQWNPFSLFGRIAVQWNYIPVSMLTPVLYFLKFDLSTFHYAQVAGTFLSLTGLYLTGRIFGYGRLVSMIPVLVLGMSGYRYWIALPHTGTFLFFFPISVALLMRATHLAKADISKVALAFLLASLAFLGSRLEPLVHFLFFVGSLSVFVGLEKGWGGWQYFRFFLALGLGLALILLINAWHFAFLFQSTAENSRAAGGLQLSEILRGSNYYWMFISLIYQPLLIMILINGVLWRLLSRFQWRLTSIHLVLLTTVEMLILGKLSTLYKSLDLYPFIRQSYINKQLVHDLTGSFKVLPVVLLAFWLVARFKDGRKMVVDEVLGAATLFFAALYITQYSWGRWPVNTNIHYFFMPPLLNWLMPLGILGLVRRWGLWPVAGLVLFHFIGETGAIALFEWIGLPWNPPRAALLELPIQALLILETTLTGIWLLKFLVEKIGYSPLPNRRLATMGSLCLVTGLGFALYKVLLPKTLKVLTEDLATPLSMDKFSAVQLKPEANDTNSMSFSIQVPESFHEKYVRAVVYAKSENKTPWAIFTVANNGASQQDITYYPNSGAWEKLEIPLKLNATSKVVSMTIGIRPNATASVEFERLQVLGEGSTPPRMIPYYKDQFPFAETKVGERYSGGNPWIVEAFESSLAMQKDALQSNGLTRKRIVDDDILKFGLDMQYKFMPAVSQTRNTAPVYASEIPYYLKMMFLGPQFARSIRPHPETTPLVGTKKEYEIRNDANADIYDYLNQVVLWTHKDYELPTQMLTAEEGSGVSRVFIAPEVRVFESDQQEFEALRGEFQQTGRLPRFVTTSDQRLKGEPRLATDIDNLVSQVELIKDDPESIEIRTSTDRAAYLVLLDLFSKGWSARVNDAPAEIFRGYLGVRFLKLPQGISQVKFSYEVPGLRVGLWLSLISFGLLSLFCLLSRRKSDEKSE